MIHIWQNRRNIKIKMALFFLCFMMCSINIACGSTKLSIKEQSDQIFIDYFARGDSDTAIQKLEELLERVNKKEGENSKNAVILMTNLATAYRILEKYDDAEQYLNEAQRISEVIKLDESPIDVIYYLLAQVASEKENLEQAIEYSKEAFKWKEKVYGIGSWNSTLVHLQMGFIYVKMEKLDEAELYIRKGLEASYEGVEKMAYVSAYFSLGDIKIKQKKYKEAIELLKQATLKYQEIYGNNSTISLELTVLVPIYIKLSEAYVGVDEYEQALDALIQGYSYMGRAPGSVEFITESIEEYKTKMFEIWKVVNDSESRSEFETWLFNDVAY